MATTKSRTPASKSTRTTKKVVAAKKPVAAKARKVVKKAVDKVDYYPNRMTFWISAAAGSIIVLIAVILAYNK